MSDTVVITYNGEQVSVPKEVADFLRQDQRRSWAERKQDQRHLSKSEFETVLSFYQTVSYSIEDAVHRNLQLKDLRRAVKQLEDQERKLIILRYNEELSMEEIGKLFGISKMAVSKRLKKLHDKLRSSVS